MNKFVSGLTDAGESMLNYFIDPETGEYLHPVIFDTDLEFDNSLLISKKIEESKSVDRVLRICMIDSGLLIKHPLFKDRIIETIDFTGEGIEDQNGHGTMVSFLWLARNPMWKLPIKIKFLVAKVLDKSIQGTEGNLISAIEWATHKNAHIINISAGFDRQIWFYNPCKGTCKICKAAEAAANKVMALYASAGNNGRTVCPARSGVYNPNSKVIAVGSKKESTGEKEKWSGKGNVYRRSNIRFRTIKKTASKEERLRMIEAMVFKLWDEKKYEKTMTYLLQLREGLIEIGADEESMRVIRDKLCRLRTLLGDKYYNEGDYNEALKFHLESLNEFEVVEGHYENALFGKYLAIGMCYAELKNYSLALENLIQARDFFEEGLVPYRDSRLHFLYEYLGISYLHEGQFLDAIRDFEKALEFSKEFYPGDDFYVHNCYLNIASAKVMVGEFEVAEELIEIISTNNELLESDKRKNIIERLKLKIKENG